jgi:hypothetical protein
MKDLRIHCNLIFFPYICPTDFHRISNGLLFFAKSKTFTSRSPYSYLKMKLKNAFIITGFFAAISLSAQETPRMTPEMTQVWEPVSRIVTPGRAPEAIIPAPSDAIVLFDGTDLSKWQHPNGNTPEWVIHDGYFAIKKGTGDIQTKQLFNDFQMHIEWRIPADVQGTSQGRGNSGIFIQGMYELQILDSYNNPTYVNGQAGSIYKQSPPLVNASRPPGEWNVYDIIYTAPTFKADGTYRTPPRITVFHNGVLIQNDFVIRGTTEWIGHPQVREHGAGPIRLQQHGSMNAPINFRNIWIREL